MIIRYKSLLLKNYGVILYNMPDYIATCFIATKVLIRHAHIIVTLYTI